MEYLEAVEIIKNPNDKFDLDLIAIRVILLELIKQSEVEILDNKPIKKVKKKGDELCPA